MKTMLETLIKKDISMKISLSNQTTNRANQKNKNKKKKLIILVVLGVLDEAKSDSESPFLEFCMYSVTSSKPLLPGPL